MLIYLEIDFLKKKCGIIDTRTKMLDIVAILNAMTTALGKTYSSDEKIGFSPDDLKSLGVKISDFNFDKIPDSLWDKRSIIVLKAREDVISSLLEGMEYVTEISSVDDCADIPYLTSGSCAEGRIKPDALKEYLPYIEIGDDVCFFLDSVSMFPGTYFIGSYDEPIEPDDEPIEPMEIIDSIAKHQHVDPVMSRKYKKTFRLSGDYKDSEAPLNEAIYNSMLDISDLDGFLLEIPEEYFQEIPQGNLSYLQNRMADFEGMEEPEKEEEVKPEPEPEIKPESKSKEEEPESKSKEEELLRLYQEMKEIQPRISELEGGN